MLQHKKLNNIILASLTILVLILGVLLFITPAAIFPDPSWGFRVMQSMQAGSGFNILTRPDPRNIADTYHEFLSWWSPGQYLVPYLFKLLFKLNTGQAASVTTTFCQLIGLAGYYLLFTRAGFSKTIATLSLVFIVGQQAFFTPYVFYNGGETLLFGFLGWFYYGCLSIKKPGIWLVIFVLLMGWVGFICKSSFIWMYAAGLLLIWIRISDGEKEIKPWLIKGFWIGIPAAVSVAAIYVFYLSKGGNPASDSAGIKLVWETFCYPLASPLISGFSIDDLTNGLLYHNDAPVFGHVASVVIVVILAVLSLLLLRAIIKNIPNKTYVSLFVIVYTVSVLFFGYAYLRQLDISYESRHFRVVGLLVVPGIIYLVSHLKLPYQLAFGAMVLFIAYFTITFYISGYDRIKNDNPHGTSGIAQQFIDKPSLDYITALDRQYKDAIFVFTSVDLALEVTHNRVVTLDPLDPDLRINFDSYVHKGHAGPIFILLPDKYIGIKASVMLKCFPGYKGFTLKELSDDYVLYYSNTYR